MDRAAGITVRGQKIKIQPYPDRRLGYIKASYDSPLGEIDSSWEYKDETFKLTVTIPANTEADVIMPNGERYTVGPGVHVFT